MKQMRGAALILILGACAGQLTGEQGEPPPPQVDAAPGAPDARPGGILAERYPGDVAIETDPSTVFSAMFEEADIDAVVANWDDVKREGLELVTDKPAASPGTKSIAMHAGGAYPEASDLFKLLPGQGYDQLWYRYYVKYDSGVPYHHTSGWLGGYNPPTPYPDPNAGQQPNGDDLISFAFEPNRQDDLLDSYNYWRGMHGSDAFWGNRIIHDRAVTTPYGQWFCVELMVKLNSDLGSGAGAEFQVWRDDVEIIHYTESGPMGWWVDAAESFCPEGASSDICNDNSSSADTMPDMQFRTSNALKLNHIWPQNFISEGEGTAWYDHMVVATERIGCLR